jgi:hypothetical protein
MAGEAGLLDREPHVLSIGSDFYVLDEITERRNDSIKGEMIQFVT